MRAGFFLQRGLTAVAILLGSSFTMWSSAAAQEFHMCDLFAIGDAAQLVGQPITNTVEGGENSRFVCARYAEHAATLLEVTQYPTVDAALVRAQGGTSIAGLGDASSLLSTPDEGVVVLRVAQGPYLVSIEVSLDDPPNEVAADDLAQRVQVVLDNLASVPLARSGPPSGCDPAAAAAIGDQLHHPDVTDVQIIGGCHYVAIATRLDDSGFAAVGTAQEICDRAAEFVYTGTLSSISVSSKGGRELAIGIKNQFCVGEL